MPSFSSFKTTNSAYWLYQGGVPCWDLSSPGNVWDTQQDQLTALASSITPWSPAGVAVPQTVGPSPYTYTAGSGPEQVFISPVAGGAVSQVKKYGVNLVNAIPIMVILAPAESVVIQYTGNAPMVVVAK